MPISDMTTEQWPDPDADGEKFDRWSEAFQYVARHYGVPISPGGVRQLAQALKAIETDDCLGRLANKLGLQIKRAAPAPGLLTSWRLPAIVRLSDGSVGVVTGLSTRQDASVVLSGEGGVATILPLDALLVQTDFIVLARPQRATVDERVDGYIAPYREHWFRAIAFRDIGAYGHVMLASLVANLLALAGVMFSMQVYDRVVPAKSFNTLYVLFVGVVLALVFDFIMRRLRTRIIDIVGKRTDMRISDLVFGHALRVKNQERPTSTGTFIAQLRDLEQVRELLTSTTLAAVADLPFFILFLVIFWLVGGPLVLIPVAALLLLVLPGIVVQRSLRAAASEAMREASLRNAMLVEAVQGIEDIKTLQAEDHFQQRWNHYNAVSADGQLRLRAITNGLAAWSHTVQTGTFAVVVFIGAPIVMEGDMTTGSLVACSILGSRMMAPMAQLTQILGRFQQAKVGLKSIDAILRMPSDHPDDETRVSVPTLRGAYKIRGAAFHYGEGAGRPALAVGELSIAAGEKIAVLGKNGAGKSTLLLAMAGMVEPVAGELLIDDLALSQVDPADLRRNVGLLTQDSRLFHGTIRENVTLGALHAPEPLLLEALSMTGADDFVRKLPRGLDHPILEGGRGLSGGQKQALLLARLLVRDPAVVLLDEPTAAMDEATERQFIARFKSWGKDRTIVVATHRMRVLELVERIIVVENGQIVLDGSKEEVLNTLRGVKKIVPPNGVRRKLSEKKTVATVAGFPFKTTQEV
ncbi:type I secretion system permease/ATPase [Agrobacterium pusense]|uniref:type I secretion system permease/ATPase n=1 Tax=Agrobacterium pusense TaxID=648995 RepID=UPI000886B9F8|nr:type I secretion system permease/ATPase [Agrobacterium pusense]OOO15710.1 ATP-binding protein [Agrobacterium pusense]WKD47960.1 type I secretion system permease/ATPase [Agrobacterium pusense]SDF44647.1 ATP-binding cassette, subfamily C, LapB [Agrobacterium pusense]